MSILKSITDKLLNNQKSIQESLTFNQIIGYDDVKEVYVLGLTAAGRVKIIFNGPAASGKSLFIEGTVEAFGEKCFFFDATTGSVEKFLQELELVQDKIEILAIDELDKWNSKEQTKLYSLFEKGIVDLNYKSYEVHIKMNPNFKIVCSSNSTKRLNAPLKSRADIFNFTEYTKEEFIQICTIKLAERMIPENIIVTILGYKLERNDKDVRRVIGLIEYLRPETDTVESVLRLLRTKDKFNAPDNDYN